MKLTEIQELIDFIAKSRLEEVHIETEAIKMHVKRNVSVPVQIASAAPAQITSASSTLSPSSPLPVEPKELASAEIEAHYITITSPMIGTFYVASHPEAPPLVREGDTIIPGTKLCIIEAMKLFNEVEAEISGKIVKILVDDVSPVEYNQPLFLVNPS